MASSVLLCPSRTHSRGACRVREHGSDAAPVLGNLGTRNRTRVSIAHRLSPSFSVPEPGLGPRCCSLTLLSVFCGFVPLQAATSPPNASSSSLCRPIRPDALSPVPQGPVPVPQSVLPCRPPCPLCAPFVTRGPAAGLSHSAPLLHLLRGLSGGGAGGWDPRNAVSFLTVCPVLGVQLVEEERQLC